MVKCFCNVGLVLLLVEDGFVVLLGYFEGHLLPVIPIVVVLLHGLPTRQPHQQFTRLLLEIHKHVKVRQHRQVIHKLRQVLMHETVEVQTHLVHLWLRSTLKTPSHCQNVVTEKHHHQQHLLILCSLQKVVQEV